METVQLQSISIGEQVVYEFRCDHIKPIADDLQVISDCAFLIADLANPLVNIASTMLGTQSFDAVNKTVSAQVLKNTGTQGHTYLLVAGVETNSGAEFYKLYGKFKIESVSEPT